MGPTKFKFKLDLMKNWASRALKISNKIMGDNFDEEQLSLLELPPNLHKSRITTSIPFQIRNPKELAT
jgi:hypothetical protein